jgi:hypothetical protein
VFAIEYSLFLTVPALLAAGFISVSRAPWQLEAHCPYDLVGIGAFVARNSLVVELLVLSILNLSPSPEILPVFGDKMPLAGSRSGSIVFAIQEFFERF